MCDSQRVLLLLKQISGLYPAAFEMEEQGCLQQQA